MNQFIEKPATNRSITKRKLVCGFGVNDSNYTTHQVIDSKRQICPYYVRWRGMIERCLSTKRQKKHPTYKGCSVCDEWRYFMSFKSWMIKQEWEGNDLDKDVKIKGNKVYSPSTCLFIPRALNTLLNDGAAMRGLHPKGVSFDRPNKKFIAQLKLNGKSTHIGYFSTPEEASEAYQAALSAKIQKLIDGDVYPMASPYLSQHIGN